MRLLIITSEPLNPRDTLRSEFELAQARHLQRHYDVAIVSVTLRHALRAEIGSLARSFRGLPRPSFWRETISGCDRVIRSASATLSGGTVRRHRIDGIQVYEGIGCGADGFRSELDAWTAAGTAAMRVYARQCGDPDLVHAHGRFLNAGALALCLSRETSIPYVYTEHSSFYRRALAPLEAAPILDEIIANAGVFSCVSPALLADVERFVGRPLLNAMITPNPAHDIFERTKPSAPDPDRTFTFLSAAALEPHKGLDVLLCAFAQAFGGDPRFRLEICGEGTLRASLEALATDLHIDDRTTFCGHQQQVAVLARMDRAHVVVVPSRIETFGLAALEGLLRGRPVIATECGGPSSIVEPDAGFLVRVGDVTALASAMRMCAAQYERFDRATIRSNALRRFGSEAFLERATTVYQMARAQPTLDARMTTLHGQA